MVHFGVSRFFRISVLCTVLHFFITRAEDDGSLDLPRLRTKREWEWKTLSVFEESAPEKIGQLKNSFTGANTKFQLMGEGANDIFELKPNGELFLLKTLDREQKSKYNLTARILDVTTNSLIEGDTTFTVEVLDINDNTPVFLEPYSGSIAERSPAGSVVMKVRATDADDPKTPNGKFTFKLLNGTDTFKISQTDGEIATLVNNLNRETQNEYKLLVEVSDFPGKGGGKSSSTIITIQIKDINDNIAGFSQRHYKFDVPEDIGLGSEIGPMNISDPDEKQNKNPSLILRSELFNVDLNQNKDAILILKQKLNYENKSTHIFTVEVDEDGVVLNPENQGRIQKAEVIINVQDVDEPPVFSQSEYNFKIKEGPQSRSVIGSVSASDTDSTKHRIKYSIEDPKSPVEINSETGVLTLIEELDRELQPLHKFYVTAEERALNGMKSYVLVTIDVEDINDNEPELVNKGEMYVCDNDQNGTLVGTIGATDKDVNLEKFRFTLAKMNSNFSLVDHKDNTASIYVTHGGFSTERSQENVLQIEITDGGNPPRKSVTALPLKMCKCDQNRLSEYCFSYSRSSVSVSALIAILLCIITILVIVILFVLRKRYQKESLVALGKPSGEIHEQLVSYDEEGGGEMDTNGYDVSILSSVRQDAGVSSPAMYAVVNKPPACKNDMAVMIEVKKDEADHDRDGGPYDTLHIYGFEGSESLAGSLSSLDSGSSHGSEIDYDLLNDWGPRFKTLAQLYGYDDDASY